MIRDEVHLGRLKLGLDLLNNCLRPRYLKFEKKVGLTFHTILSSFFKFCKSGVRPPEFFLLLFHSFRILNIFPIQKIVKIPELESFNVGGIPISFGFTYAILNY